MIGIHNSHFFGMLSMWQNIILLPAIAILSINLPPMYTSLDFDPQAGEVEISLSTLAFFVCERYDPLPKNQSKHKSNKFYLITTLGWMLAYIYSNLMNHHCLL